MYAETYLQGKTDPGIILRNLKCGIIPDKFNFGGRGCGRTYTILMLMLGQILYGPPNCTFVYYGQNDFTSRLMEKEFYEIAKARRFPIVPHNKGKQSIKFTNGQLFYFTHPGGRENQFRGTRIKRSYIDLSYTNTPTKFYDTIRQSSQEIYYG